MLLKSGVEYEASLDGIAAEVVIEFGGDVGGCRDP